MNYNHVHSKSSNNGGLRRTKTNTQDQGVSEMLSRLFMDFGRLFVALKHQIFKFLFKSEGSFAFPWLKICIAGLLVFIIFKKDLKFQVYVDPANAQTAPVEFSPTAGWFGGSEKVEVDPFADKAEDSQKVLRYKAYIRRFKDVAVSEMQQYGIPASISMAQGLLESNAGESSLSTKTNNHFGIKCFSKRCGKGHCSNFGDDHHKDFFVKFGSAWESWRAHSKLLTNGRYKNLKEHGNDYRAWAHGLKKAGYATAKDYNTSLIQLIETYQLQRLDE